MVIVNINSKGTYIRIKNKRIQLPFKSLCTENEAKNIVMQLRLKGITDYTIKDVRSVEAVSINKDRGDNVLNYKPDDVDKRDFTYQNVIEPQVKVLESSMEQSVDYTDEMSPVKNQGRLGSCVGFAVVAMKEWQEQKEHSEEVKEGKSDHRKLKTNYDYSEQWLYYKTKEIDPWPNTEGTSLRYAMKILSSIGVPPEKAWPYDDLKKGEPKHWADMVSMWALGGSYIRITSADQLIETLHNYGPTTIGFLCFREIFYTGRNGLVPLPREPWNLYGGHAVCVVGYDSEKKLFKFKNSWGTNWGQNGYGYLSLRYIQDYMLDAWYSKDIKVTRKMLKKEVLVESTKLCIAETNEGSPCKNSAKENSDYCGIHQK